MGKILKLSRIIFQKFCFINIVGLTVKIQINLITENQYSYLPVDFFYRSASYGLNQNETVEKICNNFKILFSFSWKNTKPVGKEWQYPTSGEQQQLLTSVLAGYVPATDRHRTQGMCVGFLFSASSLLLGQSSRSLNCPYHTLFHMEKNSFNKKQDINNLPERNLRPLFLIQLLIKIFSYYMKKEIRVSRTQIISVWNFSWKNESRNYTCQFTV